MSPVPKSADVCRQVAERFAAVATRSDGPVLDAGCGSGTVAQELADRRGWAIDGLDSSAELLANAEERRNRAGEPLYGALIEGDLAGKLDIATDTYGSVVSTQAGSEAMSELTRVVRPGGLMVLMVDGPTVDHLEGLAAEGVVRPLRTEAAGDVYVVVTRVV